MIDENLKKIKETYQFCVQQKEDQLRLDKFCALHLTQLSRSYIKEMIKSHFIQVNGENKKSAYLLSEGDEVEIAVPEAEDSHIKAEDIPLDIVYEDEDLLVVDKPSGMVVHPAPGSPSGTLVNALLAHTDHLSDINGVKRPGIVHRIDKDTSGLLVVAKNNQAHRFLAEQLAEHSMIRQYHGLVCGNISESSGTVDMPLGRHPKERIKMAVVENGKRAVTHFNVVQRFGTYTELIFHLETGRTHQIRVHMQAIGHPLAGDPLYSRHQHLPFKTDGQMLHAEKLGFIHPTTRKKMVFTSPLPALFRDALSYCDQHRLI
jgi:23S rRNA pseudouridine1911/1915/1917 synthase